MKQTIAMIASLTLLTGGGLLPALLGPSAPGLAEASCLQDGQIRGQEVTDPLGRTLRLTEPRRIVSLALTADEILVEWVELERVAGLTVFVDDRATTSITRLLPSSIARLEGQAEPVLALEPDLVFVSPHTTASTVQILAAAGMPVVRLHDARSLQSVLKNITLVAAAVGKQAEGRALVATLRERLDRVDAGLCPAKQPRVLLTGYGYVHGAGTLQHEWLTRAHARNAAAEAGIRGTAPLPQEAWLAFDPDWILVETAGTALEPGRIDLLGDGPLSGPLRERFRGRVVGVPRAWSGAVSHHVVRAIEEVSSLWCALR